jgi:hypothetical protein
MVPGSYRCSRKICRSIAYVYLLRVLKPQSFIFRNTLSAFLLTGLGIHLGKQCLRESAFKPCPVAVESGTYVRIVFHPLRFILMLSLRLGLVKVSLLSKFYD